MQRSLRIGIDVGGTFTDLFLLDEASGASVRHKLSSTPDDPYRAPIRGIVEILDKAGRAASDVAFVGLGTTVATNALIERKGAVTGLITTRGFRDLLEIGRQKRPHVYDLFRRRPAPLVPREFRLEVEERVGGDRSVITPLDRDGVRRVAEELRRLGATSVAICFLNSYANPAHEQEAADIVRASWPDADITVSHALLPEFREYERLSSTVVNAALMPVMRRYLGRFKEEVRRLGIPEAPFVMSSGGGVFTPELASARPIDTLFSGPSGGVSGALHLAALAGSSSIITFDMGGTSTDVCLVREGRAETTTARSIDGLPIKAMALDIHTVGAGGSSIAWIDAGGLLRVGPHSAGAVPGPACYGAPGAEPTVTDANVVLGRLNQDHLLDGALRIDAGRSFAAIDEMVAKPKGLTVHEAAAAILAVSNTNIAQAIRYVSVERGLDPADFTLVAFGGAGPLHAAAIARELGMEVLIPPGPGVLCAMGVLTKDIAIDLSQTRILRHGGPGVAAEIDAIYAELERRAVAILAGSGLPTGGLVIERAVDARYVGQNFELAVALGREPFGAPAYGRMRSGFDAEHRRLYGYDQPDKELELVTFRIVASLAVPRPDLAQAAGPRRTGALAPVAHRRVFFEGEEDVVRCPVYRRAEIAAGDVLAGPAVIEQMDATTVVPPGFEARADHVLNLVLKQL